MQISDFTVMCDNCGRKYTIPSDSLELDYAYAQLPSLPNLSPLFRLLSVRSGHTKKILYFTKRWVNFPRKSRVSFKVLPHSCVQPRIFMPDCTSILRSIISCCTDHTLCVLPSLLCS